MSLSALPHTRQRIVVIEDNPDLRAGLTTALHILGGFDVYEAPDGVQGLELCVAKLPHCAVIDIKMPHLDGLQVIRALRGDPATMDLPIVILTALALDADVYRGAAAGTDVYLIKPVEPEALIAAIRQAIAQTPQARLQRLMTLAQETEATHDA
jgi:CheY-like chemotaxis protein